MKTSKYRKTGNNGLFDKEETLNKLSAIGNPLSKLSAVIDFEMFRPELEAAMLTQEKKNTAGAKPIDVLLMFKIVLLKRLYNLSDEQAEFQINDRLSFREFLGLASGDKVPDQKTVWDFQNRLIKKKLEETLFEHFHKYLDDKGLFVNEGKIVDASFVEVPRQRNTREENEIIKSGRGEELWNDNPHKKRQKDIDARWTTKREQKYYGYKDHAKIDAKSKLIDTYEVTSAEVHDSQPIKKLLSEQDRGQLFFADSAYTGKPITNLLRRFRIKPRIIERAYKNKPLTEKQKKKNKTKSKMRCRCEHVFGYVTNSMGDFFTRNIGFERVNGVVGLINLTYNICRYEQIMRLKLLPMQTHAGLMKKY